MNIFSYIDKHGDSTFDECEFNEVDSAIFSALTYIELDGLVSKNRFKKRTIKDIGDEFFEKKYSKNDKKNILAVRNAIKMLRYIKDTKRYGGLKLYNYVYESSDEEQFCAMMIDVTEKLVFVSFEGTDHLVSGWREDFMMSYQFPVLSQRRAINYVNRRLVFERKSVILGGHSKGGNLAMTSGMYANYLVRRKIVKIYNHDGPGLLLPQITSKNYANIESKMVKIIPNYSLVGLILRHGNDYVVVRSFRKSIFAHDMFSWVVRGCEFERCELSSFSKFLDDGLINFLNQYDMEMRKKLVYSLFNIFDEAGIVSLVDIADNKKLLLDLIYKSRDIDKDTRQFLADFVSLIVRCYTESTLDDLGLLKSSKWGREI